MIRSTIFFVLLVQFNAQTNTYLGIVNHQTEWHFQCAPNRSEIFNPFYNETFRCRSSSLNFSMIHSEIDFTFLCRKSSRLIWIIVDLYQYQSWLNTLDIKDLFLNVGLNHRIILNDSRNELHNYRNRSILINAFYVPFERIEMIRKESIDILIEMNYRRIYLNRCLFNLKDDLTWMEWMEQHCNSDHSRMFLIRSAKCYFSPKFLFEPVEIVHFDLDDNATSFPDFNVFLAIDDEMSETISSTYTDNYQHQLSSILILVSSFSHLSIWILTLIILILIIILIFFVYTLCNHHDLSPLNRSAHICTDGSSPALPLTQ